MAARRVKKPKSRAASKALDQLVTQFADPLAFLRELVQNSLDASTELIEVEVFYDDDAEGCVVRVRDTGIGMDRGIIDTKLTRLFSSSKEDDLTKIGKFGIGFVSIFAINPQLVVLETGRDGESWRLIFNPDRSFERRQLESPVEGTTVSVFTTYPEGALSKLQQDCRRTVSYWCRHSEVEIHFNGEPVNEAFALPEALVSVHHEIEGTDVVAAPSLEAKGFHGYYNRGLTLLEGQDSPLAHVSFKLRSRYLEHTLTRDNILHDEGYERALAEVRTAAYDKLPGRFAEVMERAQTPQSWALARVVAAYPGNAAQALQRAKMFPTASGLQPFTALRPPLLFHSEVDEFAQAATAAGFSVLTADASDDSDMLELLADWKQPVRRLTASLLHFSRQTALDPADQTLLEAIAVADRTLPKLVAIEALNTPSVWKDRFCGYIPAERTVAEAPGLEMPRRSEGIGVFLSHPFWRKLRQLHAVQRELALSLACRKLALELGLGTKGDHKVFDRLFSSVRARSVPS